MFHTLALIYTFSGIIIAICAYRVGIRLGAERLKALQEKEVKVQQITPAINYVNNVLLPDPEDPRWELLENPARMQLANVWVYMDGKTKEIRVGTLTNYLRWTESVKATKYCNAVCDAWCNRKSFESIENAEFPQLKPTGV